MFDAYSTYNYLPTSPTDQYHYYYSCHHPINHSEQSFRSLALLTSHTYYVHYALFLSFFPHSSAAYSYSYTSCRCDIAIRGHTQSGLVLTCLNLFTVTLDSACHIYLAVILDLQSITQSDTRHRGVGCQDRYSVRTAIQDTFLLYSVHSSSSTQCAAVPSYCEDPPPEPKTSTHNLVTIHLRGLLAASTVQQVARPASVSSSSLLENPILHTSACGSLCVPMLHICHLASTASTDDRSPVAFVACRNKVSRVCANVNIIKNNNNNISSSSDNNIDRSTNHPHRRHPKKHLSAQLKCFTLSQTALALMTLPCVACSLAPLRLTY